MSGGYFDYKQHDITDIVDKLEDYLDSIEGQLESKEVSAKIVQTINVLRAAHVMVNRIDWFLSGDDGEERFHQRWNEELKDKRLW